MNSKFEYDLKIFSDFILFIVFLFTFVFTVAYTKEKKRTEKKNNALLLISSVLLTLLYPLLIQIFQEGQLVSSYNESNFFNQLLTLRRD